jgi:acyl-coenzyme A synthetase/AMP-(fatty) acid ligase
MIITRDVIHANTKIEEPDGSVHTKADLVSLINKWHTVFDSLNLFSGDRIAVNDAQSIEHFALMFCALERGVVIVTIPRHTLLVDNRAEFDYVDLNIRCVFNGRWTTERCQWQLEQHQMSIVHDAYESTSPVIVATPTTDAMLSQTSGTTGKPKKFLHSHQGLHQAASTASQLYYREDDRVLLYCSLNHMGIITMQILPVLFAGCHILSHWAFDGKILFNTMLTKKPNKTILFPLNLADMIKAPEWETCDLTHLEEVISGGMTLPKVFVKQLFDKGVKKIHNVYGMSEALPPMFTFAITPETDVATIWHDEYGANMGKLVSDWQTKIVRGILCVKGTTSAYGGDIDACKDADGFYKTEDRVSKYNDISWIKGRMDKTFRKNDVLINLNHIRSLLLGMPNFRYVLPVGVDNKIYLALDTDGPMPSLDEINTLVLTKLGINYRIDEIVKAAVLEDADQIKTIVKMVQARR